MTRLKLLVGTAAVFSSTLASRNGTTSNHQSRLLRAVLPERQLPEYGARQPVGGAIGTAGAIATAPFRGNSYAYYGGGGSRPGYNPNTDSYGARNGFVCQPGTRFRGEDGRQHLCQ